MHDQPKYKPLGQTEFFPDNRQSRPVLANTMLAATCGTAIRFYTGKSSKLSKDGTETDVDVFPITVDKALIETGSRTL